MDTKKKLEYVLQIIDIENILEQYRDLIVNEAQTVGICKDILMGRPLKNIRYHNKPQK